MDSIRPIAVLSYRFIGPDPAPEQLDFECSAFALKIQDGVATFQFVHPPYNDREGQSHLLEFLTSFEGDLLLQGAPGHTDFRLDSGRFVDGGWFGALLYATVTSGGPEAEAFERRDFPWRYHRFSEDPIVSALISRYEDYRRGREKLLVMAFFCLSALEVLFRPSRNGSGRKGLGDALNVAKRVLSRLGEFVSNYGTHHTARKISAQSKESELSPAECAWIEWVTRELILRAGILRQSVSDSQFERLSSLPASADEEKG